METFTALKDFVRNPDFAKQRKKAIKGINYSMIDAPVVDTIKSVNTLPYCFTLQCCFGHFHYSGRKEFRVPDQLPVSDSEPDILYQLAYIAFCIEKSEPGYQLFAELSDLPRINPDYIQFGCAEWFWKQQVNTFVIQVEPERFSDQDSGMVNRQEAQLLESVRDTFFDSITLLLKQ